MDALPNNKEAFRTVFCRVNACSPETFRRKVFLKCFFPQALPVGLFMRALSAPSIDKAMLAIDRLGDVRSANEVNALVDEYYRYIEEGAGFWIRLCKARLSGRRLIRLYNRTVRRNADLALGEQDELEKSPIRYFRRSLIFKTREVLKNRARYEPCRPQNNV